MTIKSRLRSGFFMAVYLLFPVVYFCYNAGEATRLETFSYRISMSWVIFALSGLIAVLIAGLTISIQSVRVALVNPINSLRGE
ncbi:hypothetical protein SAMN04488128_102412 [Chitinophaga eiseniae]|uniref:Uncharacterized protein n=1 Tax=Chitinophaga eiseniae TaxID=634771 RepID=A0A1T4QKD4_9BACT|nr:hypothetical protein SAMN04488128_102412 [Chitinophaga eiseniae]